MIKIVISGIEYHKIVETAEKNPNTNLLDDVLSEAEFFIAENYFPTCDHEYVFKKGWSAWEKFGAEIHLFLQDFDNEVA